MAPAAGPPTSPRILLVEDEASIRRGLSDVFRFRGYTVEHAEDGRAGLRRILDEPWDLVVLDVMLPELSGFEVCAKVRETGNEVPVLMLTAKGDEDDIVRGFHVGANDYVTKPFGVRELVARVEALLRRTARAVPERFVAGPFEVVVTERTAVCEGESVRLTAREVRILRVLALDAGRIVSRRMLLRDAWDMNNAEEIETRTVDVHIAKLRKKLGPRGEAIETVRGEGYRLCP